eukprot:CAMPEP_0196582374 /NCGR_PEP_ID=MMETSP1081-20130531/38693_1 /TAXON_ID=36882 /ORGANISM="Pyramimonas amylifera, Strain CCMP720" /LENGTH=334 /DNA_ID=CAMNT_0041902917 /DNA_START=300 /DNA_END=1304 /DNA_ORIENTATION=-
MEDFASVVSPKTQGGYLFAGVYDGHGGESAGRILSQNLHTIVANNMSTMGEKSSEKDLETTLTNAFYEFDESLLDMLEKKDGEEANCGSTATVSLLWRNRLVVANVGDSRAVISRRGRAVDLSAEHRPYGKNATSVREVERIRDAGGWITDGRVMGILAVSRAFGDNEFKRGLSKLLVDGVLSSLWSKQFAKSVNFSAPPVVVTPDVLAVSLYPEDEFLIVASDGLWEVTTSAQAVRFVERFLAKESGADVIQRATEALVADAVTRRRTSDNVACVIVKLAAEESSDNLAAPLTSDPSNIVAEYRATDSKEYFNDDESILDKLRNVFRSFFDKK